MSGPVFLDTNVLVYAALQSDQRSDAARVLLARGGMISVQVLNEFTNVASRKLRRPWLEIARAVEAICFLCPPPLPLTLATHRTTPLGGSPRAPGSPSMTR